MTPKPAGELDSLRAFVETSRGPCLVLDGASRVASANRAFCEAFGIPAGEAEGRLVSDLGGGRWAFPGLPGLLDAALGGEVRDFEVEHDFGPIGIRSLRINARRISRGDGESGGAHVLMAIEDVTDRLQSRELSQLLAAIVASSDDTIVGKSFEGVITCWNRGAERMFGYTAGEIIGRHISTLTPPEEPDRWAGILEQAVPGERLDHFETRRLAKDGQILDLAVTVSPIRDFSQDRRIAQAVREGQKQRQLVIDAVPALICYLDREGRYRLANEAYRTWFGLDPRAMLGRTVREVLGDREYEAIRPHIERTMAGEPQKFEQDLPADGGIRTIQVTYTPDLDANGRVVGCVVLGNDISDCKRMEEMLRGGRRAMARALRRDDRGILPWRAGRRPGDWRAPGRATAGDQSRLRQANRPGRRQFRGQDAPRGHPRDRGRRDSDLRGGGRDRRAGAVGDLHSRPGGPLVRGQGEAD